MRSQSFTTPFEFSDLDTRLYVPESVVNLEPIASLRPPAILEKCGSEDDAV